MISGIPNPQIMCYYPPPIPHTNQEGRAILLSFLKLLFVLSYSLLRIITWRAVYSQNYHSGWWIRAITEKHGKLQVSHQSLTKLLPRTQTVPWQICQTCPRGPRPTWFYEKKLIAQEINESSPLLSFIPEQGPFHVFLNLQEDVCIEDLQIYPRENLQGNIWIRLTQKTKALQNQFGHHCCLSCMDNTSKPQSL